MKKKTFALSQTLLFIIGIVAISYAIGSEIGGVEGYKVPSDWKEVNPKNVNPKLTTGKGAYSYSSGSTLYDTPDGYQWVDTKGDLYATSKSTGYEGVPVGKHGINLANSPAVATTPTVVSQTGPPLATARQPTTTSILTDAQLFCLDPANQGNVACSGAPGEVGAGTTAGRAAGVGARAGDTPYDSGRDLRAGAGDTADRLEYQESRIKDLEQNTKHPYDEALDPEHGQTPATVPTEATEFTGESFIFDLVFAFAVSQGVNWVTSRYGDFDEEQSKILSDAAFIGTLIGRQAKYFETTTNYGGAIGAGIAAWYILENYKDVEIKTVTFECSMWEAPKGGENCEECNDDLLGCSEYQCKSLGKGCELLNPGTSEELCSWINRNDAEPPQISPWTDVLDEDYSYTPDNRISPPDRGVEIVPTNGGCIKAFTPLRFGVTLDEPATCRLDFARKGSYEDMLFNFGGSSLSKYNHTHTMSLPALEENGTVIESGINMTMYTRCEDANGNSNIANFVFKFCVEEGEDITPPLISYLGINPKPVPYNQSSSEIYILVNEPVSSCKWDYFDESFDKMDYEMTCSTNPTIKNAQTFYKCDTNLTGIKDRTENDFYFRCEDRNENKNRESYKLTLIGTQPLFIDWAEPNDTTIKDSASPLKVTFEVKTSSGYQDGASFCYYKPTFIIQDYIQFRYETTIMTHEHSQELFFEESNYEYTIKCIDAGGNADTMNITFYVETDIDPPVVVRTYKEEGYLKVITDESGECVYNTDEDIGCRYEFDDGIDMQTIAENEHFVEWNTQETFYIKCKDSFDIPPIYDSCSIVTRPSEGQQL
jgi:hypothetical protein